MDGVCESMLAAILTPAVFSTELSASQAPVAATPWNAVGTALRGHNHMDC